MADIKKVIWGNKSIPFPHRGTSIRMTFVVIVIVIVIINVILIVIDNVIDIVVVMINSNSNRQKGYELNKWKILENGLE